MAVPPGSPLFGARRSASYKKAQETYVASLGKQTITFPGSLTLNVNNIMGPAIVAYPMIYQRSGWLFPTSILAVVCVLSALSGTMLCEAMQRIPGNHNFSQRYEFTTTVRHYWGERWYLISQVLVNLCLQCLNVASIIVAAQVMDELFVYMFGSTTGLQYYGGSSLMVKSQFADMHDVPYGISAGFVTCLLVCLPFGTMNLDENMWFQWFSVVALIISCAMFVCEYLSLPLHSEWCPPFNEGLQNHAQVLGVVVFSYAYVITVPSWVNEKAPSVSTNKSIWWSCLFGMLLKCLVGYLAAVSYPGLSTQANVLQVMNDSHIGGHAYHRITRFAVYLFNFGTIVPGIPIFSILTRYNLLVGEVCGPKAAFVYSFILPWFISMFLYRGAGFQNLVNWTALLLQGFVNFTIPALLYIFALRRYPVKKKIGKCQETELNESKNAEGKYLMAQSNGSANVLHDLQEPPEFSLDATGEEITNQGDAMPVDAVPDWCIRLLWRVPADLSTPNGYSAETAQFLEQKKILIAWLATIILTLLVVVTLLIAVFYLAFKGVDIVDA